MDRGAWWATAHRAAKSHTRLKQPGTHRHRYLMCVESNNICLCCIHCVCVFSCFRLFETPWTVAHQAPLSMGILQARILEWVAMPSSRRSS